MTAYHSSWIS